MLMSSSLGSSDSEIYSMTRDDVFSILQLGVEYSMHQFANATVENLIAHITRFWSIWIWHEGTSLASHGILAVMVGVAYDLFVFKTENEVGQRCNPHAYTLLIHS